jgi:hypothetical protein
MRSRSGQMDHATSQKVPHEVIGSLNWCNPSSYTTASGFNPASNSEENQGIRPPGRKGRLALNLTAIREPTVQKMWEPQCLTILRARMARHRETFNLYFCLFQVPVNVLSTCHVTYCNVLMNLLHLITWDIHNDIQLALRDHIYGHIMRSSGINLTVQFSWKSYTCAIYRPFFVSYITSTSASL